MVGDGHQLRDINICKNTQMVVQRIKIIQNLLSIKLGNIDIIFGIEWLSKLGDIKTNEYC